MASSENYQKEKKIYQISLVALLVLLIGTNVYHMRVNTIKIDSLENKVQEIDDELAGAYLQLNDMSKQMDEKIAEIERLNGDVTSLREAKEQLEKEKRMILNNSTKYKGRQDELQKKLEAYAALLLEKDNEIVRLKELTGVLNDRVSEEQREKQRYKDSVLQVQQQLAKSQATVKAASVLEARNIIFTAYSKRDKAETGTEFKGRRIEKMLLSFNFGKNNAAKSGTRTVYMVIKDPEDAVVYSNTTTGTNTFMVNGVEKTGTDTKDILFANRQEKVEFEFILSSYPPGVYHVSFYCEGEEIGKSEFTIK